MNLRKFLVLCMFGLLVESGMCSSDNELCDRVINAQASVCSALSDKHFSEDEVGVVTPGLLDTLALEQSKRTAEKEGLDQKIQFMVFDVGVVDTLLDMAKLCEWPLSGDEEFQLRKIVRQNQHVSETLNRNIMCFLDLLPSLKDSGLSLLALIHFSEAQLIALNSLNTIMREVHMRKILVRMQAQRLRALKEQEHEVDVAPFDTRSVPFEEVSVLAVDRKSPEITELANCEDWYMIEDDGVIPSQPNDEELDPLGASMTSSPATSEPIDLFGCKRRSLSGSGGLSSSGENSLGIGDGNNPNRLRSLSSAEQLLLDEINHEHQAEQDSGTELFLSLDSSLENQLLGSIRDDLSEDK